MTAVFHTETPWWDKIQHRYGGQRLDRRDHSRAHFQADGLQAAHNRVLGVYRLVLMLRFGGFILFAKLAELKTGGSNAAHRLPQRWH